MNIVNAGNDYIIYGQEIQTYQTLPINTYRIQFDKMKGFYLTYHNDLTVKEKVYGSYRKKVQKILNSFKLFQRNMGVILSGPKGSGKSMFARLLAEEAKKNNLPLILVDTPFSGIENFISSIDQECIILFDEFEKTFKIDIENDYNPQDSLLSLFDGIDSGKKLYIITCNSTDNLTSYILNRPGRFHYHFEMTPPNEEEIKEYLLDNLNKNTYQYINAIVNLSLHYSFTYDILRAIVFELNHGYSLKETLMDLNIEKERYINVVIEISFSNGASAISDVISIDTMSTGEISRWCNLKKETIPPKYFAHCEYVNILFSPSELITGEKGYYIDPKKIKIHWNNDSELINLNKDERQELEEFLNSFQILNIKFNKPNFLYSRKFNI